jgi:energy-coupling factor transporter ATP-binding protein EcfA2
MTTRKCPWRGLLPYDEEDAPRFFGRSDDVANVMRRLMSERLVVLTGPSAAGKTSLLRAGVVPGLRHLRSEQLESSPYPSVGVTLVMRDWEVGGRTIDQIVSAAFVKAAKRLRKVDPDSFERLRPASSGRSLSFGERINLAEMDGESSEGYGGLSSSLRLILVFDQLEEILRLGKGPERERNVSAVVDLIGALFQEHPNHRILLSLRDEYHADLRDLEVISGGVFGRTVWLSPIQRSAVRAVVMGPARAVRVKVDPAIVPKIENLLDSADAQDHHETASTDPINLLHLQAVLHAIWDVHVQTHPSGPGATNRPIDETTLAEAIRGSATPANSAEQNSKVQLAASGADPDRALGAAFVTIALRRAVVDTFGPESRDEAGGRVEDIQGDLLKGVASRMAPFLSAGGFKVSIPESGLLQKALRDDVEVLGLGQKEALEILGRVQAATNAARWKWPLSESVLDLAAGAQNVPYDPDLVSGVARQKQWPTRRALASLLAASLQTLDRLKVANILKQCGQENGQRLWQLVHDGMGDPLSAWGDDWRVSFRDAVARLSVSRGYGIRIAYERDTPSVVNHANWWGCWIGPARGSESAPLHRVEFYDCDFRGSIFQACSIADVGFTRCKLDGTTFKKCDLDDVRFDACVSQGQGVAFRDGSLGDVRFEPAGEPRPYQHTILDGAALKGRVLFKDLGLTLSGFSGLTSDCGAELVFDNCNMQYCSWDEAGGESGDRIKPRFINQTQTVRYSSDSLTGSELRADRA